MSTISTHVLNLDNGLPAVGVQVYLYAPGASEPVAHGITDSDGRVRDWSHQVSLAHGIYRLCFATGDWFAVQQKKCFYPEVSIAFHIDGERDHYHVPLLLNSYGYSTYRGS